MALIIPQNGFGSQLGTAVGTGLGQGLQDLAQMQMQQMQQRRQMQTAQQALQGAGYSPEQVASFGSSATDPAVLRDLLKEGIRAPGREQFARELRNISGAEQVSRDDVDTTAGIPRPDVMESNVPPAMNSDQEFKLAQLKMQKGEIAERQQATRFKETKEIRKEIVTASKGAKENLVRLGLMERLNKEDKLVDAKYYEFLKKVGFDFPAMLNPESQEFQKLSIDFLRDAKAVFGARVTNFEAQQFLKGIPTLSQTKEGRERVIKNLRMFNKASVERGKVMREVLKEHKGVPPFDLAEIVDQRMDPYLDNILKDSEMFEPRSTMSNVLSTSADEPAPGDFPVGAQLRNDGTGKVEKVLREGPSGKFWENA